MMGHKICCNGDKWIIVPKIILVTHPFLSGALQPSPRPLIGSGKISAQCSCFSRRCLIGIISLFTDLAAYVGSPAKANFNIHLSPVHWDV